MSQYDPQEPDYIEETEPHEDETAPEEPAYQGSASDPLFGLLLAGAVSVGLIPLVDTDADLRYTVAWGALALFAVAAWLLGTFPRIQRERPENLAWGLAFGLILGIPLLAFGSGVLDDITELMFPSMRPGTVLAYLIFVMPLGETLFFRGLMQQYRSFWEVGILATVWALILVFPLINSGPYPLIMAIILLMSNLLYGYVSGRNGLAAAWLSQITVNLLILFFPFI